MPVGTVYSKTSQNRCEEERLNATGSSMVEHELCRIQKTPEDVFIGLWV
jgi:hypothetical protein